MRDRICILMYCIKLLINSPYVAGSTVYPLVCSLRKHLWNVSIYIFVSMYEINNTGQWVFIMKTFTVSPSLFYMNMIDTVIAEEDIYCLM